ncbi:MAG: glycosyltransferase family 39 protein [Dehalococcoidia bacterium]|nr:glycosyltransferase family 39 protein [Dehalococcoidia bacterium]
MRRVERWLAVPEARWIIAIFALSLVVRLAFVAYVHPNPRDGRYDDSVFYDAAARHLAAGDGYVFDPTVWKAPDGSAIYLGQQDVTATALWPPGYPATLSVIYLATGNSLWAARLFNVLVGAMTPVLVFLIARKLFDLTAGAFAGLALAILPGHVLFTGVLLTETYFGFLLALTITICVYFVFDRQRPRPALLAGLGALVAFTGYVRGEFLAYGAVIALLLLIRYRRQAALPLAALAVGAAVIVAPWVVRNAVQMDALIAGTTGSGRVAFQAHNPATNGGRSLEAVLRLEAPYQRLNRTKAEVESNAAGSRMARRWALTHIPRELRLIPQRTYFFLGSDDAGVTWTQSNKPWFGAAGADKLIRLSNFAFYGLMALALAGAPLWFRRRDLRMWVLLALVPFYVLLFGVLFVGDPRYHYALYIPLSVFASVSLAEIWRMTGERWRQLTGGRSVAPVARETVGR